MKLKLLAAILFSLTTAVQADVIVYPKNGQSQEQTEKDKYECFQWAKQNTGVDPTSTSSQQASSGGSSVGRGVARGAVAGLIVGNVADGSGSKGAAAGAILGGTSSAVKDNRKKSAQQQQSATARQTYDRAYAACMEGRGYSVK